MVGDWPRYGICHGCMCSVKSLGVILGPASSRATRQPASVSRFAAQPPVAPEPTTTASNGSFGTDTCGIEVSVHRAKPIGRNGSKYHPAVIHVRKRGGIM